MQKIISATDVDQLLPQTQCQRCGYLGCLPYAEAIVEKSEAINRCPPGGDDLLVKLSELTAQSSTTVNPECGAVIPRAVAIIDPKVCIGCTKCLPACPVDAIVGGPKRMHTILFDRCTGCELCFEPCPVDCITMVQPRPGLEGWSISQKNQAKLDYKFSTIRKSNQRNTMRIPNFSDSVELPTASLSQVTQDVAREALARALARAKN